MTGLFLKALRGTAEITGHTEGLNASIGALFGLLVLTILCGLGLAAIYLALKALKWFIVHAV